MLAIGNPFSIGQTVTSGIVSALRRRSWGDQNYEDFIQTDAAINLGSSGGALVNLRGELVGMNAAILDTGDPMDGNVGIGFAIPVNTVRNIAGQLMKYGSASHGQLGVVVAAPTGDVFQPSSAPNRPGVVIAKVEPGSSAAHAGLKIGDTITTFNSSPVRDATDLRIKTAMLRVGDIVELNIVRDGQALSVRATLTAKSEKKALKEEPLVALAGRGRRWQLNALVLMYRHLIDRRDTTPEATERVRDPASRLYWGLAILQTIMFAELVVLFLASTVG